jgi:hypothetical protein
MISPDETMIEGEWLVENGRVRTNAAEQRIQALVNGRLVHLVDDPAGGAWLRLYKDPADGRLWEMTYPHSEMHGGGPRRLRVVTPEEASQRFGWKEHEV